jgi:death-on-curing protein
VNAFEHLGVDDLLNLAVHVGVGPVRDIGLPDSAVARPRSSAFGQDAHPTLALEAAALVHSVAKDHASIDGNKRLAWLAAMVFLDLNGRAPKLSDDQAFEPLCDWTIDPRLWPRRVRSSLRKSRVLSPGLSCNQSSSGCHQSVRVPRARGELRTVRGKRTAGQLRAHRVE